MLGDCKDGDADVAWTVVDGAQKGARLTTAEVVAQSNAEIAVTGTAWAKLKRSQRGGPGGAAARPDAEALLLKTRVYARISPNEKENIVRMHIAKVVYGIEQLVALPYATPYKMYCSMS